MQSIDTTMYSVGQEIGTAMPSRGESRGEETGLFALLLNLFLEEMPQETEMGAQGIQVPEQEEKTVCPLAPFLPAHVADKL